jgi:hypothetical protein
MPLLNYTTSVSVTRSVEAITKVLAKAGATRISVDYRQVTGVSTTPVGLDFVLHTHNGLRSFRLPVDPEPVHEVLKSQNIASKLQTEAHAERVAWRIVKDWLEVQLALIETGMVTADEVLLAYMLTDRDGTTVYDLYSSGTAEALEA